MFSELSEKRASEINSIRGENNQKIYREQLLNIGNNQDQRDAFKNNKNSF